MLAVKMAQVTLLLFLILLLHNGHARAQSAVADSVDPSVSNAIRIFAAATGTQAGYYNGLQYRRYPNFIHTGHPFFLADSLIAGTITYDGVHYENIRLQYDEVNDELITTDVQGDNLVQIHKAKVSAFTIGRYNFIHHSAGTYPGAGYYRVLYDGRSQIIAKEKKLIQTTPGQTNAETIRSVDASTDYYLKTSKGYEKFGRLNALLTTFGKHRKAVAGFLKDKKSKYRQDKENLFYQAVTFYDQLTD